MDYGILTLVPILVVLVLALVTKRTLEPLILGTVTAYIIICGWGFPQGWMNAFFDVASNRDHQWMFMVCALFGSLITLLGASHGTLGFSTWAIFFAGLFYVEAGVPELGYAGAIDTFVHVIPYTFYAIAAVVLVPLFCFGLIPKLGAMKKAYSRVRTTGRVYSPDSPALKGSLLDLVLPVGGC